MKILGLDGSSKLILQSTGHAVCGRVQKEMTVRERCRQNILEIKKRPPVRKDRIKRIRSNFWLYAQKGEEGDKYDKTGE